MAKERQPEDFLVEECLEAWMGKPLSTLMWQTKWSITSPHAVGSSVNWWTMAIGLAIYHHVKGAQDTLRAVLSDPNDFMKQEARTDKGHAFLGLVGLYTARMACQAQGITDLAMILDNWILQFYAQMKFTSNNPDSPADEVFISAGQRIRASDELIGSKLEYLWKRGLGMTHAEIREHYPASANMGERVYENQGIFTAYAFANVIIKDLMDDVDRVQAAYRSGGWKGLSNLIKVGTRGKFTDERFSDGTYASVLAARFGLDNGRWAAVTDSIGGLAVQFPTGLYARENTQGSGVIDNVKQEVRAEDSVHGSFTHTITGRKVVFQLRTDPDGVHISEENGGSVPPTIPPPEQPQTITPLSLFESANKNLGYGNGGSEEFNTGTITGISKIEANHYVIRKGGGKFPWSTETIFINKDGDAVILSETMYLANGDVANIRTFWKDINAPGVMWLPRDINGVFWSTGFAVFDNLSGDPSHLPYNVPASPAIQHSAVRTESTIVRNSRGFTRSDRMNENTEVYTFLINGQGFFPYANWESYHNGTKVNEAGGDTILPLGDACRIYTMFEDGSEGYTWIGSNPSGPYIPSVRPIPPVVKKKSWASRFV